MRLIKEFYYENFVKPSLPNFYLNSKVKTADMILNKIGYSNYQKILFLTLLFLFLADGAEMIIIPIILPSLTDDWKISSSEKGLLFSIGLIGNMISSLLASKASDLYGRRKLIILGTLLISVFGILSPFSSNINYFAACRFFVGAGIGVIVPVANTLAAESIPVYNRGVYIGNLFLCLPIGCIYVSIIGIFIMPNLEIEGWRKLVFISAIPSVIAIILLLKIKESPRYLLAMEKYDEAVEIFNQMGIYNQVSVSEEEKKLLIKESREYKEKSVDTGSLGAVFSVKYLKTTLILILSWFALGIIQNSRAYVMPTILAHKYIGTEKKPGTEMFIDVILLSLLNMPITVFATIVSGIKFCGRKYTIITGFMISGIFCLLSLRSYDFIVLLQGVVQIGLGLGFSVISVYSSEIYPTHIRTLGTAVGYIFSKVAGIISPFICEYIINKSSLLSIFLPLGVLSFITVIAVYLLPIETLGRSLDEASSISVHQDIRINLELENNNHNFEIDEGKGNARYKRFNEDIEFKDQI